MKRAVPVFLFALLGGCNSSDFTSPDRVFLRVEPLASAEPSAEVTHRFTVLNAGKRNVYLPACNNLVRLGVTIRRAGEPEHVIPSASMCIAIYTATPVELEPGESYSGVASLSRLDDALVQPFVSYSLARSAQHLRRATAPAL